MKKINEILIVKFIAMLMLCFVASVALSSCDKDKDDDPGSISGTYYYYDNRYGKFDYDDSITFSNGTVVEENYGEIYRGTYTVKDGMVEMIFNYGYGDYETVIATIIDSKTLNIYGFYYKKP